MSHCCCDDWGQEDAKGRIERSSRNRHTRRIVDESQEQVLPNIAHGREGQCTCSHNASEVIFKHGDASTFNGNISAGAYGDANINGSQGSTAFTPSPAISSQA